MPLELDVPPKAADESQPLSCLDKGGKALMKGRGWRKVSWLGRTLSSLGGRRLEPAALDVRQRPFALAPAVWL